MKIQDKKHEHPCFDCASGMAAGLIATGNFEQYVPPEFSLDTAGNKKPKLYANATWVAREGKRSSDGDFRYDPEIVYSCSSCGNKGIMTGPTVHKTGKFLHCGVVDTVPKDVQQKYAELRKAWGESKPASKRATDTGGVLVVPSRVLNTW